MPLSPFDFWVFFPAAALCVIFIGIDKSGLGSGLGVLATPLMTVFMFSSKDAIGIILRSSASATSSPCATTGASTIGASCA
jgi:uncharacterized membrane protein YfcA